MLRDALAVLLFVLALLALGAALWHGGIGWYVTAGSLAIGAMIAGARDGD